MKENLFKIGFVVTIIGGACLDSESMVFPLSMIVVGLVMISVWGC